MEQILEHSSRRARTAESAQPPNLFHSQTRQGRQGQQETNEKHIMPTRTIAQRQHRNNRPGATPEGQRAGRPLLKIPEFQINTLKQQGKGSSEFHPETPEQQGKGSRDRTSPCWPCCQRTAGTAKSNKASGVRPPSAGSTRNQTKHTLPP